MVPAALRRARRAAADAQRQGRPQGAARARRAARPRGAGAVRRARRTSSRSAIAGDLARGAAARAASACDDNFFDLGGHSLLVVQVHRRLREVLPAPRRRSPTCSASRPMRALAELPGDGDGGDARVAAGPGPRRARAATLARAHGARRGATTPSGERRVSDAAIAAGERASPSSAWRAASPARATSTSSGATCATASSRSVRSPTRSCARRASTRALLARPALRARRRACSTTSTCSTPSSSASARKDAGDPRSAAPPLPRVRLGGARGRRPRARDASTARSASSPAAA